MLKGPSKIDNSEKLAT